jgi:hypothetical protein
VAGTITLGFITVGLVAFFSSWFIILLLLSLSSYLSLHATPLAFRKQKPAGQVWNEGWKLEEFFGFTTDFVITVLGKVQAASSAAKMADLLAATGVDLRAKADDPDGKILPGLLAAAKIELP